MGSVHAHGVIVTAVACPGSPPHGSGKLPKEVTTALQGPNPSVLQGLRAAP